MGKSDTSGAVEEVYVTAGQQVREGDALLAVRPAQVIVPQVTAERVAALWQQVAGGYAGEPEAAAAAAVAALLKRRRTDKGRCRCSPPRATAR